MSVRQLLIIGLGGALGAAFRVGAAGIPDQAVIADAIPLPTLIANFAGCLLLGLLVANPTSDGWRWFAATGFCGGLTTMSTFAVEIVDGLAINTLATLGYIVLSISLGIGGYTVASHCSLTDWTQQTPRAVGFAIAGILVLAGIRSGVGAVDALAQEGLGILLAFFFAAGFGAVLRAALTTDGPIERQILGVLLANVLGSFLLGLLTGVGDVNVLTATGLIDAANEPAGAIGSASILIAGTGALGAFTTFSTAVGQVATVAETDSRGSPLRLLATTLVLVLIAAWVGRLFGTL